MKRLIVAATVVLAGPFAVAVRAEPKYEGKPLGHWVKRLRESEPGPAWDAAATAVIAFGPDAAPAVPVLVGMLDDRSEAFRVNVGYILCKIGPAARSAAPALLQQLRDHKARSPQMVIRILACIDADPADTVPVFITALDDRHLRPAALDALCSLGPSARTAIPAIRRTLRDARSEQPPEDSMSGSQLVYTLRRLGGAAVPLLLEFFDDGDVMFQRSSAEVLGEFGLVARSAVPTLTRAMHNDDPLVRRSAAFALWQVAGDLTGVPVLAALVKKGEPALAGFAALLLGEIGPSAQAALPDLVSAYHSADRNLRSAAEAAIGNIDPALASKLNSARSVVPPK